MERIKALAAFAALGQDTRLGVFRLLIKAGPDGMAAGEIGQILDVRPNTLSANLAVLVNAGLLRSERHGRSIRYAADMDGLRGLLDYLLQDCCGGRSELCRSVIDEILTPACLGAPA